MRRPGGAGPALERGCECGGPDPGARSTGAWRPGGLAREAGGHRVAGAQAELAPDGRRERDPDDAGRRSVARSEPELTHDGAMDRARERGRRLAEGRGRRGVDRSRRRGRRGATDDVADHEEGCGTDDVEGAAEAL